MTAMTDLTGKVCVVTGATSGIGQATAKGLAARGATVGLVARNRERGEATLAQLGTAAGRARLFVADLSSQREVRGLADEVLAAWERLDVLINNAGAVIGRKSLSEDGIELTFALNHLAPFLLTCLLLDRLRATPGSRVVTVASRAHHYGRIDFDNLRGEKGYVAQLVYGRSKLANILFTRELARRVGAAGPVANCMHPGVVATRFGEGGGALTRLWFKLFRPFLRTAGQGADTVIWLAAAPEAGRVSGEYFVDRRIASTTTMARDPDLARRLWEVSERMTGCPAEGRELPLTVPRTAP